MRFVTRQRFLSSFSVFGLCLGACSNAVSETPVALELVLAADASSSVDEREYTLQVRGYVDAFKDAEIIAAINGLGPTGMAVTFVEWGSRFNQVQSVYWMHINSPEKSIAFSRAIEEYASKLAASGTALGEVVLYSVDLLVGNQFDGLRQIIDVSADDRYNAGSAPSYAKTIAQKNGVTVNGLAIDPTGVLTAYFYNNVITGPGSFAIRATSYEDFGQAIKLKLLREISGQGSVALLHPKEKGPVQN